MKKLILLSLLCLATNTLLRGQIAKGTITLGGEIGIGYVFAESVAWSGYDDTFSPSFGLMFTDHWMVGTSLGTSTNILELNYYINPRSERYNFYLGAGALVPLLDWSDEPFFDFQFGFNKFINGNIAFDANITYFVYPPSRLSLNLGLQPFVSESDRDKGASGVSAFRKGDLLINPSFATISYFGNRYPDNLIEATFNPNLGLFLSGHTLVGLSLSGHFLTRFGEAFKYSYPQNPHLAIAPYFRYYFGNAQKYWSRWYGQLGFSFTRSSSESNVHKLDLWGTFLNNRWGANWFLTPHLAFDVGLDLRYNLGTNVEGFTPIRSFNGPRGDRGFRVGVSIGVQYFMQREN
jgi:hypothetical protein